ncbi:DUF3090 domain-containing protein [Georgenia halophila]|uniref:DUF3090 domain-containing protein n=1 Tax=Georgenia halophila TaxID=620889 RepID=A0ABP8LC84_9MICO
MPPLVHAFDWPDRFVVGTVGEPGSRIFYLQARTRDDLVSVALEKEQSAALAAGIDQVLDELMARPDNPFSVPAVSPGALADDEPLDQPVDEQFRVGTLTLGWDPSSSQIVIEAAALADPAEEGDPDASEPDEVFIVRIPVGAARAFAQRTHEVVNAGRPVCPVCHAPMDPGSHVCRRADGLS